MLHYIAGKRLAAGRLTVVDATNVQRRGRASRWSSWPGRTTCCRSRSCSTCRRASASSATPAGRTGRSAPRRPPAARPAAPVAARRSAGRASARCTCCAASTRSAGASIVRQRLLNDYARPDRAVRRDRRRARLPGRAGDAARPARLPRSPGTTPGGRSTRCPRPGRTAVFVGDLVDRGPDSPGVLRLVMGMVAAGHALAVPGNHENKLVRALSGRKVQVSHGLAETLEPAGRRGRRSSARQVAEFCRGLVSHLVLDDGRLVVAHAGLKEAYHGPGVGPGAQLRAVRRHHRRDRRVRPAGPLPVGERLPRAGDGALRAHADARAGVGQQHDVPGHRLRVRRPADRAALPGAGDRLGAGRAGLVRAGQAAGGHRRDAGPPAAGRDPDVLDIDDVLGKRVVETGHGTAGSRSGRRTPPARSR